MDVNDFIFNLRTANDNNKLELIKKITECPINDDLVEAVFYSLYNLSKYKNQVLFVDILHKNTFDSKFRNKMVSYIVKIWPEIETNRKDKFFYFLEKFCDMKVVEILEMKCHSEIKNFLLRKKTALTTQEIDDIIAYTLLEKNLGSVRHNLELIVSQKESVSSDAIKTLKLESYKKEISEERRSVFCNAYKKIKDNC